MRKRKNMLLAKELLSKAALKVCTLPGYIHGYLLEGINGE